MPTYKNDGNRSVSVKNTSGNSVLVAPGEAVETYEVLTVSGMTKTAEAPYWNPATAVHAVTSSGAEDDKTVALNNLADAVEVYNASAGLVTVYLRSKANTPGLVVPAGSLRRIDGLKNMVNQLVLTFSASVTAGQCYVTEIKE
jgi:hypothetical protein